MTASLRNRRTGRKNYEQTKGTIRTTPSTWRHGLAAYCPRNRRSCSRVILATQGAPQRPLKDRESDRERPGGQDMSKPTAYRSSPRAFITGVVPLNALDRGGLLTPLHWLFTSRFLFRRPAYFAAICTFTVWHRFFLSVTILLCLPSMQQTFFLWKCSWRALL